MWTFSLSETCIKCWMRTRIRSRSICTRVVVLRLKLCMLAISSLSFSQSKTCFPTFSHLCSVGLIVLCSMCSLLNHFTSTFGLWLRVSEVFQGAMCKIDFIAGCDSSASNKQMQTITIDAAPLSSLPRIGVFLPLCVSKPAHCIKIKAAHRL